MKRLGLLAIVLLPIVSCTPAKQKAGNAMVIEIEEFRELHRRLPSNLGELGYVDSEHAEFHYQKESESRYTVWHGTSLGESVVYDSETGRWE